MKTLRDHLRGHGAFRAFAHPTYSRYGNRDGFVLHFGRVHAGAVLYNGAMTKDQVKEILDRVLTWPPEDQERVARFVHQVEQRRVADDIADEEWKIIEERAARRDLATDEEVEEVFSRYRSA